MQMSHVAMAADATQDACGVRRSWINGLDNGGVTVAARILGDACVPRGDAYRFGKGAGREIERMPEAVQRFCPVLTEDVMRRVTVVAHGNGAMARLQPGAVLLLHDMAVGARLRIVGEIRGAACVDERETADPERQPQRQTQQDGVTQAHEASLVV
jgi:hypothetical protein